MSCKYRWDIKKREDEKLDEDEEITTTEEDKELGEEQEAMSRSVFEPIKKTLNMNKRKVTDYKNNNCVIFPRVQCADLDLGLKVGSLSSSTQISLASLR